MLHIVCVNWGNWEGRGVEYVNKLFDMVRRNLPEGFEGVFECFTDNPDEPGYADGIKLNWTPSYLKGWFNKLYLFSDDAFPKGDRVVFFDLDTLILGDIELLARYDGPFAILRDVYRPDGLQSSVMAWEAGTKDEIFASYIKAGRPINYPGGDQAWIERTQLECAVRLQDVFPGMFVSYKQTKGIPDRASVVFFHGLPRPHEVLDGWVPEVWKVGGINYAEFKAKSNVSNDLIRENIKSALKRNLPVFDLAPEPHDRHCVIVGGGPSLASQLDEIKWRAELGQDIWVLNNAYDAIAITGVLPAVQVIADARRENAEFIDDNATEFLLASQCHPDTFAVALLGLDPLQTVTLWHADTEIAREVLSELEPREVPLIGGGNTVGMLAMSLAFLRGYRKIHLYGMDSCYDGDTHHAYEQKLNDGEDTVWVQYLDKTYRCARWMADQAQTFIDMYKWYHAQGCIVTAHGKGLIPDIERHFRFSPPINPAQLRAAEVVKRLTNAARPWVAEIGVFRGHMSRALLKSRPGLELIMVDSWEGSGASYEGDSGDWHSGLSQEEQDGFYQEALSVQNENPKDVTIIRKRSVDAAAQLSARFQEEFKRTGLLAMAFIDADHSYEGCKADIAAWWPLVRKGGYIGGHDYANPDFPKFGVKRAVDEFVSKINGKLELGENLTWFVKKGD